MTLFSGREYIFYKFITSHIYSFQKRVIWSNIAQSYEQIANLQLIYKSRDTDYNYFCIFSSNENFRVKL